MTLSEFPALDEISNPKHKDVLSHNASLDHAGLAKLDQENSTFSSPFTFCDQYCNVDSSLSTPDSIKQDASSIHEQMVAEIILPQAQFTTESISQVLSEEAHDGRIQILENGSTSSSVDNALANNSSTIDKRPSRT